MIYSIRDFTLQYGKKNKQKYFAFGHRALEYRLPKKLNKKKLNNLYFSFCIFNIKKPPSRPLGHFAPAK